MTTLTSKILILGTFAASVIFFQNCAKQNFDGSDLSSVSLTGAKVENGNEVITADRIPTNTNQAANLRVYDSSVGDGTKVIRVVQKITGGGAGLRGCTGPMNLYNSVCNKDSEYQLITKAWGANSYNSANDTYSTDMEVSAQNWPFTTYFTRYILADGSYTEVTFTPAQIVQTLPARLQWVYTHVKACVGPTPSPATIGASCSVEGDTRTNACGTATCQFK